MLYGKKPLAAALLALSCALGVTACAPGPETVCGGLSGALPTAEETPDGRLTATLNGEPFQEPGSWSTNSNGSIVAGLLFLGIAKDESGTAVSDLVGRGAFPICVPIGARSETSGDAGYESTFVTDAEHTGMVAILAEEGALLLGRFEVTLNDTRGGEPAVFTDGAFRIPRR